MALQDFGRAMEGGQVLAGATCCATPLSATRAAPEVQGRPAGSFPCTIAKTGKYDEAGAWVMLPRGGLIFLVALSLVSGPMGVGQASGDVEALVLNDPEGDTGDLPCSPAIDLLQLSVSWGSAGVLLDYTFRDLSVVTSPVAMVHDIGGRCIWSYTEFVADFGSGLMEDGIYIDHVALPAFVTGWRIYLHEEQIELPASVDGNRIQVTIPFEVLGEPAAGDRIGDFNIQVNTSPGGPVYEQDRVPDNSMPCACWLEYPDS